MFLHSQDNMPLPSYSFSNLEYFKHVRYNPNTTKLINKNRDSFPKNNALYTNEFGHDDIVILQTKLKKADKDLYYVLFSEGPSADPKFYFIKVNKPNEYFGNLPGEELVIPGNGYAYTKGRANNDFLKTRKSRCYVSGKLRSGSYFN